MVGVLDDKENITLLVKFTDIFRSTLILYFNDVYIFTLGVYLGYEIILLFWHIVQLSILNIVQLSRSPLRPTEWRVSNGIIKSGTIKVEEYKSLKEMITDLDKFLLYYLFSKRHSSLKRELNVRIPYEALQSWYNLDSNHL